MRHLIDSNKLFVCLDKDEDLFSNLEALASKENWQAAHLSGIGAIKDVELGVYNLEKQAYDRKKFPQVAELLTLEGNLTFKDGKPFFHIHVVLSGKDYRCYGGHLFAAKIAVVCELNIRPFKGKITREINPAIGLAHCAMHNT